ncbi:hypothetical protein SANT12839_057940 [Streptomyces antimycoticus]|uniref:Uncharacterized protein n=1 Tax=Streptomyces antimycoticus TaxID=68175 RepID=A0A4D4K9I6_9ACTN|nr:hypothetical protein SANT12839_057940 [Streptomyces antimycoticus]
MTVAVGAGLSLAVLPTGSASAAEDLQVRCNDIPGLVDAINQVIDNTPDNRAPKEASLAAPTAPPRWTRPRRGNSCQATTSKTPSELSLKGDPAGEIRRGLAGSGVRRIGFPR